jgi:deoxyribonuclease V
MRMADAYPPPGAATWPTSAAELRGLQRRLAGTRMPAWTPGPEPLAIAGCFVCFPRGAHGPGDAGDPAWAAAAAIRAGRPAGQAVVAARAGAPYAAGLLALREGPALERAVRALDALPDVLLVDATGRDHPRRAGLALHLGAVLEVPTVGVTHRLLRAAGEDPGPEAGARSPILLDGELVAYWLRTRAGARPLAVHAGWRVSPAEAVDIVLRATGGARTPEPLRMARRLARVARAFEPPRAGNPRRNMEKPPTGFPEPPGEDPGDVSQARDPHHALNVPVGEPDPTEWPDPYDRRPDPRDPDDPQAHTVPGATSTSEPHPKQDPEAAPWAEGPKRDKLDE